MSVAALSLIAAGGAALVAGVFFAFSTFVMAGLERVEPEQGMRAMQGINEAAVAAPLMILLFGTAVVALVLGGVTLWSDEPIVGRSWMLWGVALYVVGNIVVTGAGNVPMNNTLAEMSAADSGGQRYWSTYITRWTLINHVRTVTAAGAAAAFFMAYLRTRG